MSNMPQSFKFLCKAPENFPIQIEKYVSKLTGLKLYVSHVSGPVVDGYISVATEAHDDDGLPHTLEHMIFLGSESYPYPGVLDLMANKIYASGTNAWTEVDNTTYTLSTLEKQGFLQMLPIYLDHIFYPLLNESGYITEVHHINGNGEDGGVVYSEMQSCENDDETIIERRMHKLLYPNENCCYRYETGGVLHNIRTSLTYDKVCEYHRKMYKPNNVSIVVAGEIKAQEVIEVLEKFEEKILSKNPETWKLVEKPFANPIDPLSTSIQETVLFPADNEKSSNGLVTIGWRGPSINSFEELISLDVLIGYLIESSISPMGSYFIEKNSICNRIQYNIEEYKETSILVSFINTQLEHVNEIKTKFDHIIAEIISQPSLFDLERMKNIVKMKIAEVVDKLEDDPHETVSRLCIGDFLYGDSTQEQFHQRLSIAQTFEKLKDRNEGYWIDLLKKWIHQTPSVVVIAKPSEELMRENAKADEQRVAERKAKYGKKGLKEFAQRVENAIEENDNTEIPDEVLNQMQVPLLNNIKLRDIKTIEADTSANQNGLPTNCDELDYLQIQIDHIDTTNFIQVALLIDTNKIDLDLKKYLQLYIKLLYELPIKNDQVDLTHDQVVFELNKDLLEFDGSIGIDGSEFEAGIYPQYLWIYIKVTIDKFEQALKWLKYSTFDSVFDENEIKINVEKLSKEIVRRKQQPLDLLHACLIDTLFVHESNLCQNSILTQEDFLKDLNLSDVKSKLSQLKENLLKKENLRFYFCADLNKLTEKLGDASCFNRTWCKYFTPSLFKTSTKFQVAQTSKFKKEREIIGKHDVIACSGSTESSYLRVVSPITIDSYLHTDYPALLVLKEYFCQSEGPLWEAVRGPGYCYYESINVNPECAQLELCLDECSNLTKAYEATRNLMTDYMSNEEAFDEDMFETAKNSLVYLLIDSLKSISSLAEHSMLRFFKGTNKDSLNILLKNIENVQIEDLRRLHETHLMKLFNQDTSNCFVVCNPAKLDTIVNDFKKKFHINLEKHQKLHSQN